MVSFLFFMDPAFASEGPSFGLDCPFFLRRSTDRRTCVVQWNTFYGLAIVLAVIAFIVAARPVTLRMIYRKKTKASRRQARQNGRLFCCAGAAHPSEKICTYFTWNIYLSNDCVL